MMKRPNRAVLNDALDEFRDAMRRFVVRGMRRVRGKTVEDAIYESLSPNQASQFNRNLQNNGSIESAIDIGDFPNLVRKNWRPVFSQQFGDNMNVQNALYIIKEARDSAAHPSTEDLDAEYTRVALYHIVDVLDKINALEAKKRVEEYREKLFRSEPPQLLLNEPPEVIPPNIEGTQDTFEEAEPTVNLQQVDGNEVTPPLPDPRLSSKSRQKEKYTYFQELIDQLREQHNFTKARRAGEGQRYYSFASGFTGIKYLAGFNRPQIVYVRLLIDFGDREKNKGFFDVLKKREAEINAQFDVRLCWERRDDVQKSQINVYREGSIDSDASALEAFRAWHIENLLKFKKVFTPEIERARETLKVRTNAGTGNYEYAGKPLNIPIIRYILNVLEPRQEYVPVSTFLEILAEYHLQRGGEPPQLKDFHTSTYDILCAMEAEGRAERYRDAGKDYWKLLPDNSGADETETVPVSDIVSSVETESGCSQNKLDRLLRSLSSAFSRSKVK